VPPVLRVRDLRTHYFGFRGTRVVKAVDGISFSVEAGQTFGLVGESGCGKTTTCHSLVRLLAPSARIVGGSIELDGENLLEKSAAEMRTIRGRRIATILQDPMASLDPLFTIYDQVAEPAYYHRGLRGQTLRQRVKELLTAVRIPSPEVRMKSFPHQMSGGMRQRIVGAIAQAGGPEVLIADEPTTNLDVTIQLQYLNLLKDLQRASGVALIFVTHNLGIVAKMCDNVAVMYAGKIVEMQSVRGLFYRPKHPYTRALLDSIPKLGVKEPLYGIPGQPPDLSDLPAGCSFHPRCQHVMERCRIEEPPQHDMGDGASARCWLPIEEAARGESVSGRASRSAFDARGESVSGRASRSAFDARGESQRG
jgi:oligopeptide/dipeptide ABC transporter ATP-binding protein